MSRAERTKNKTFEKLYRIMGYRRRQSDDNTRICPETAKASTAFRDHVTVVDLGRLNHSTTSVIAQ
jgi:hypothetical protein